MGLDMTFYRVHKTNIEGVSYNEEIAYFGKSCYPLHHWIVANTGGDINYGDYRELTKESLIKLRNYFIDILQKATDGQNVTDREYIKHNMKIFDEEDIDAFFVRFIINVIYEVNNILYFTNFDEQKIIYFAS